MSNAIAGIPKIRDTAGHIYRYGVEPISLLAAWPRTFGWELVR